MPPSAENSWHLDRKVPIALIVTLVLQAATFGWLASSLNERVGQLEAYVIEAKAKAGAVAAAERDRDDRLVRLETLMGEIQRTLANIDRKLDQRSHPKPLR